MSIDHAQLGRVLAEVNRSASARFVLRARASGGVNETWLLHAPDGRRAVLKVGLWSLDHLHRAATAVERLRAQGYPTPQWLQVGAVDDGPTFHLQEFVPGVPVSPLTADAARLVVALIDTHAGLDPWPDRDWSAYITADLAICAEDLRRNTPSTVALVERYERLVAGLGPVRLPGGEFVHGDFHDGNVLLHRGEVSGVIDIEACGSGTRVIDFAWLLRDSYGAEEADPEVRRMFRKAGEAAAGPEVLAYCASVTALDTLRWCAHHTPAELPALLARMNRLASDLSKANGS